MSINQNINETPNYLCLYGVGENKEYDDTTVIYPTSIGCEFRLSLESGLSLDYVVFTSNSNNFAFGADKDSKIYKFNPNSPGSSEIILNVCATTVNSAAELIDITADENKHTVKITQDTQSSCYVLLDDKKMSHCESVSSEAYQANTYYEKQNNKYTLLTSSSTPSDWPGENKYFKITSTFPLGSSYEVFFFGGCLYGTQYIAQCQCDIFKFNFEGYIKNGETSTNKVTMKMSPCYDNINSEYGMLCHWVNIDLSNQSQTSGYQMCKTLKTASSSIVEAYQRPNIGPDLIPPSWVFHPVITSNSDNIIKQINIKIGNIHIEGGSVATYIGNFTLPSGATSPSDVRIILNDIKPQTDLNGFICTSDSSSTPTTLILNCEYPAIALRAGDILEFQCQAINNADQESTWVPTNALTFVNDGKFKVYNQGGWANVQPYGYVDGKWWVAPWYGIYRYDGTNNKWIAAE